MKGISFVKSYIFNNKKGSGTAGTFFIVENVRLSVATD